MKKWKVTAELNMNAQNYQTVIVKANTERKAAMFAEEAFKRIGAFYITNLTVERIEKEEFGNDR